MGEGQEIVSRVLRYEAGAAKEFVETYIRTVTIVLRRDMRLPPEGEEEVSQTVFEKLWENDFRRLRQWNGRGSIGSFLRTMTRRLALDWIQARGTVIDPPYGKPPPESWMPWPAGEGVVTLEAKTVLADLRKILLQGIDGLSDRCRETLKLRFFEDWRNPEIAEHLGITATNVAATVYQCLKGLRDVLARDWGLCAWPINVF